MIVMNITSMYQAQINITVTSAFNATPNASYSIKKNGTSLNFTYPMEAYINVMALNKSGNYNISYYQIVTPNSNDTSSDLGASI
jgi:hypothetical protein